MMYCQAKQQRSSAPTSLRQFAAAGVTALTAFPKMGSLRLCHDQLDIMVESSPATLSNKQQATSQINDAMKKILATLPNGSDLATIVSNLTSQRTPMTPAAVNEAFSEGFWTLMQTQFLGKDIARTVDGQLVTFGSSGPSNFDFPKFHFVVQNNQGILRSEEAPATPGSYYPLPRGRLPVMNVELFIENGKVSRMRLLTDAPFAVNSKRQQAEFAAREAYDNKFKLAAAMWLAIDSGTQAQKKEFELALNEYASALTSYWKADNAVAKQDIHGLLNTKFAVISAHRHRLVEAFPEGLMEDYNEASADPATKALYKKYTDGKAALAKAKDAQTQADQEYLACEKLHQQPEF